MRSLQIGAVGLCTLIGTLTMATHRAELNLSDDGLKLLAEYEGFSYDVYLDSANVYTVGMGSTRDLEGNRLTANSKLSEEELMQLVVRDVKVAEKCVTEHFNGDYMPQSVYDSMVSLVYNVGCFGTRYNTRKVKETDIKQFSDKLDWKNVCFTMSDFVNIGVVPNQGLINRRGKEQEHCIKDL